MSSCLSFCNVKSHQWLNLSANSLKLAKMKFKFWHFFLMYFLMYYFRFFKIKSHFSSTIWLMAQFISKLQDKSSPLSLFSGIFKYDIFQSFIFSPLFSIRHDFIQATNHDTEITITCICPENILHKINQKSTAAETVAENQYACVIPIKHIFYLPRKKSMLVCFKIGEKRWLNVIMFSECFKTSCNTVA